MTTLLIFVMTYQLSSQILHSKLHRRQPVLNGFQSLKFQHPDLDPEAELKGPWPCICSRPWVWRDCWETAMVGRGFLLRSHWAPQGDQQLHHWALLGPLGHIGTSAQLLCSKTCRRIHYWCIWPFPLTSLIPTIATAALLVQICLFLKGRGQGRKSQKIHYTLYPLGWGCIN